MIVKRILKILACLLVAVLVLLLIVTIALNTTYVQDKMVARVVTYLSEKLQTRVTVEHLNFDLFRCDVRLQGLSVEDREQRPLLQVGLITADIDLPALWHHEVRIPEVHVEDVQAALHKPSRDSVANWQFIIDAFKRDSLKKQPQPEATKRKMTFDVNRFAFDRVRVSYNERQFSLAALHYTREPLDSTLQPLHHLVIEDFYFKNEHHRPRKNTGKPNRGFFDPQYLEVTANLKLDLDYLHADSLHGVLHSCTFTDSITGIDIRDLRATVTATPQQVLLEDLLVQQTDTKVEIDSAVIVLPDKQTERPLAYHTSLIQGHTILRDISRPFAPPLREFKMPVMFRCYMHGNIDEIAFNEVEVSTPDKHLLVLAKGAVHNMRNKHGLHVHFDVPRMYAKKGMAERIIHQFPIKRFLMDEVHALGNINFHGGFDVFYKLVNVKGTVGTTVGDLNADIILDSKKHYLMGQATTEGFHLGEVVDMDQLGDVSLSANFKFDISKARTAVMRRRKGGKLPMGEITAHVTEASYLFAKTRNLTARIVSDGALAEGKIMLPGSHMDIYCIFSFTNTRELKKMKFKPGLKFHDLFSSKKASKKDSKKDSKKAKKKADAGRV